MKANIKKILENIKSRKSMPKAVYGKKTKTDEDLKRGKFKIKRPNNELL